MTDYCWSLLLEVAVSGMFKRIEHPWSYNEPVPLNVQQPYGLSLELLHIETLLRNTSKTWSWRCLRMR